MEEKTLTEISIEWAFLEYNLKVKSIEKTEIFDSILYCVTLEDLNGIVSIRQLEDSIKEKLKFTFFGMDLKIKTRKDMLKLQVDAKEFKNSWRVADKGDEVYTNGNVEGTIIYEDSDFYVISVDSTK